MSQREKHGRIVAGGIVCAGATAVLASWTSQPAAAQAEMLPVFLVSAEEGRVSFLDAKGQNETALTMGKGSICVGLAEGKKNYRQMACSFQPGSGIIGGNRVSVYWDSSAGSATRSDSDDVALKQALNLRVVRNGSHGYDCVSAPLEVTTKIELRRRDTAAAALLEAPERSRPTFSASQSCSPAGKAALETALARIRSIGDIVHVACW